MVDLFWTKILFSQETVFYPGYFTKDKNRCSGARNDSLSIHSYKKERHHFLKKQAITTKEHLSIPGISKSLPENPVLREHFEFVTWIKIWNTTISQAKRHILTEQR